MRPLILQCLSWQTIVFLILGWLLVEDVIRRSISGQPVAIVFVKDILLLVAYSLFLVYLANHKIKVWKPPFLAPLLLFVLFVIINFSLSGNLLIIALSFRSYLWYTPLLFLGYYLFKSREGLFKFLQLISYTAVPLFLFAVFQYAFWKKVDYPLFHPFRSTNQFHTFYTSTAAIPIYRITSFFGDSQRFATISLFIFFISLGLYLINQKAPSLRRKLMLIPIISAYGSIILSGSRAAFGGSLIGIFIYFILCAFLAKKENFPLIKGLMRFVTVTTAIILILATLSYSGLTTASFQLSTFSALNKEYRSRFELETNALADNTKLLSKKGSILSSGYQYTSIPLTSDWIKSYSVESGISKIIYEMGFLGLALYCIFFGSLIYYVGRIIYKLKGSNLNYFSIAVVVIIFLFLFKFVIHYGAGDDAFTLIPMWLLVGILFRLPELDRATPLDHNSTPNSAS